MRPSRRNSCVTKDAFSYNHTNRNPSAFWLMNCWIITSWEVLLFVLLIQLVISLAYICVLIFCCSEFVLKKLFLSNYTFLFVAVCLPLERDIIFAYLHIGDKNDTLTSRHGYPRKQKYTGKKNYNRN